MRPCHLTESRGFTLIELMITVAIIAILAAVAVPSYQDYVRRGKITEATSMLAELRIKMEQYYQDNQTYVGGSCAPSAGSSKYFTFACSAGPSASAYTIKASGNAAQGMSGYSYTIDENNAKTSTVPGGTGATCWITKQGESC